MSSQQETTNGRIVVGVDGSPSSSAALSWAVRQAGLTGGTVDAVTAWHYPVMFGSAPMVTVGPEVADFAGDAATLLRDTIEEAVGSDCPVEVSPIVREGNAARILLDAADGAELLVVGNRGRGGFTGALLGSVSQHCVYHASCPVVIMRTADPE